MKFQTSTVALLRAMSAVLPVAPSKPDSFARIRFEVREHSMFLSTTDGRTAIVAEVGVDVWDHEQLPHVLELTVVDTKKVMEVHKPGKVEGLTEDDVSIVITVEDGSWRSEDVAGLFPTTDALELPLAEADLGRPDIVGVVGGRVHGWLHATGGGEHLVLDHAPMQMSLAAFDKAQKAYDAPMVVRFTQDGKAAVVQVGGDVIGLTVASDITSDTFREYNGGESLLQSWNRWSAVLPDSTRELRVDGAVAKWKDEEADAHRKRLDTHREQFESTADVVIVPTARPQDPPPLDTDLLISASDLIVTAQLGSQSMLQRKLRIGWGLAARLLEELATLGVVGPSDGSSATRDVLMKDPIEAREAIVDAHPTDTTEASTDA